MTEQEITDALTQMRKIAEWVANALQRRLRRALGSHISK